MMGKRPDMVHLDVDGKGKRFRFEAPSGWDLVALVLAASCLAKELPPIVQAARAAAGVP